MGVGEERRPQRSLITLLHACGALEVPHLSNEGADWAHIAPWYSANG